MLKMEATGFSETSVYLYQTAGQLIPEDSITYLRNKLYQNFIFIKEVHPYVFNWQKILNEVSRLRNRTIFTRCIMAARGNWVSSMHAMYDDDDDDHFTFSKNSTVAI